MLTERLTNAKNWGFNSLILFCHVLWISQFVKNSMPLHFFIHRNKKGYTPRHVFTDTHQDLVKSSGEWLTNTSQSCSVVAALIAGVGFATVSAVPGGLKQDNTGRPVHENKLPFDVFSLAALTALCSSVTALVIFLAILTSRYQEKDFLKVLWNFMLQILN